MNKNLKATSIVESMIVMLIVVTGIVWLFQLFVESQHLANQTENRITAIEIAREGIEAINNIRDTNWILFAADYPNCWNTKNYDANCINNSSTSSDILHNSSFTLSQWSDEKWYLENETNNETRTYSDQNYRDTYAVKKDTNGFYTQSTGTSFLPLFTREIKVTYEDTNGDGVINSNDQKMHIESIVQRNTQKWTSWKVELKTVLTNWKY